MQHVLHRTLIIRLSSVGDILLSSLLLRVLRKGYPQTNIDLLVKEHYVDLVSQNPHVSRVLTYPTQSGISDLLRFRRMIRSENYDLIIDLHDSLRSRVICFGNASVVRVKKRKLARFLLVKTKWDIYEWCGGSPSVAERYLETLAPLQLQNDGGGLEMFIANEDTEKAAHLLSTAGVSSETDLIGLAPSARHQNKMWLKDRFAEAACELASSKQSAIILFGSADEHQRCDEIEGMIRKRTVNKQVVNLAGRLSLRETAALMDKCSIIVTNDSGLMHVASARKRRVVAIFGPTVKELGFFPFGTRSVVVQREDLSCRPCTHIGLPSCPKGHFRCMKEIHSSDVVNAARSLLTS